MTDPSVVGPDGNRVVQDFSTFLDITDVDPSATWREVSGPFSGAFWTTPIPERAIFENPKQGGVYKFDVKVSGVTTGANFVLPLAGADVLAWIKSEIPHVKNIAALQKKEILRMAQLIGIYSPSAASTWVIQVYERIGAVGFDYGLDSVNIAEGSPTPEFQRFKPWAHIYSQTMIDYPYTTVNGVVVEGTRVNYCLVLSIDYTWCAKE